MSKGKYYSTLKLMEQIEHTHLTHVEQFKFAKTIQGIDSNSHSVEGSVTYGHKLKNLETIKHIVIVVSPISNYQGSSSSNQSR